MDDPWSALSSAEYRSMSINQKLALQLTRGSPRAVSKLLDGGAPVDGSPEVRIRPLLAAAIGGQIESMKLLVGRGADLEISQACDLRDGDSSDGEVWLRKGSRAVHAAACCGQVEAINLLFKLGADPDAVDNYGDTALFKACEKTISGRRLLMVRELLAGGANAAVANDVGSLCIHRAAEAGHTDVLALLVSAAPTSISVANRNGYTALAYATLGGHGEAVAFLLSAGASDKGVWLEKGESSLTMAINGGHETIIGMFLDRRGIEAAGGLSVIPRAMVAAIIFKRMKILQMLLNVEGEEKQKHWANTTAGSMPMLHGATVRRSFAALHMLFAAGADLAAEAVHGRTARDLIPYAMPGYKEQDGEKEVAIQAALERLFERAPACRARSWAWPAGALTAVGVALGVVSHGKAVVGPLGASVYRPVEGRLFLRRFARYSEK